MPTRIADTRLLNLDWAKGVMQDLALAKIRVARRDAMAEARIAKIKAECADANAADKADIEVFTANLEKYCLAHPAQFIKPRKIVTDFGRFGFRMVDKKLFCDDEDPVITWARERGYTDLLNVKTTLDREAAKKRIEAGEKIPGCSVPSGEKVEITVHKHLLEEASEARED